MERSRTEKELNLHLEASAVPNEESAESRNSLSDCLTKTALVSFRNVNNNNDNSKHTQIEAYATNTNCSSREAKETKVDNKVNLRKHGERACHACTRSAFTPGADGGVFFFNSSSGGQRKKDERSNLR